MKRFKVDDRVRVEGEPEEGYVIGALGDQSVVVSFEEKGSWVGRSKAVPIGNVTLVTPNPNWPLDEREEYPS